MARLARLPGIDRPTGAGEGARVPRLRTRFYAFLSYSHHDKELADWLHRELETFRVPHALAGKLTANGVVPRRLSPIFRDQQDLSAGGELAEEIKAALAASQFLVVLCSPTAAKSRWANQEIENFKRTRPEGCVLAAVVGGEPFASDIPGRESEECFPPALRYKYDRRGHQTARRAEPLAADFRASGEGKRLAFLKLVAGMLGVGLDELVQREQTRRQQRLAFLAAASIAGMAVTSTLAVTAFQGRNAAREQRRQAEGLVAFMLGDLKDKLEPIGKLDALDGVGSRVLAYYSQQDASELSDAALTQRSRALSLMAQVADARGDNPTALKLYRQAMAGTAEAMRRNPADDRAIFDHAQNAFLVGQMAQLGGDYRMAEPYLREYQRLARRLAALQPDNMKYRMEVQYADVDLGILLYDQRKFADALAEFNDATRTMEAIATADPSNSSYRQSIAESLTWMADANRARGDYVRAIRLRERSVSIYKELVAQYGNAKYKARLTPALRLLGALYLDQGQANLADQNFRASIAEADQLSSLEPDNAQWRDSEARSKLLLAKSLLAANRRDQAAAEANDACRTVGALLKRRSPKPEWSQTWFSCLVLQGRLSLANGQADEALGFARQAVRAAETRKTADKVDDLFRVARAYRLLGDVEEARGDVDGARQAWNNGLSAIPLDVPQLPDEIAEHAWLLQRLGRGPQAQGLTARLKSIGYRLQT